MNYIASIFCTFIICHSPQKSSFAQKVYKPALCSSARPFAPYSSLGQAVGSGPACQGLPLWGSWRAQARLRGQGCCQTALRSDRIAPTTSLPIAARRLSGDRLALSVTPVACHLSQRERLWHSASLPVSFCRSLWYTYFAALPAHFIREGGESNELYSIFCSVCRSKCNVVLHLQVA